MLSSKDRMRGKKTILSFFLFLCWKSCLTEGKSDKKCFLLSTGSSGKSIVPTLEKVRKNRAKEIIQFPQTTISFPDRNGDNPGQKIGSLKRARTMIKKVMFHQCFSNPVSCFR